MVFIYTLEGGEFEILAEAEWWIQSAIENPLENVQNLVRNLKDDYPGQEVYLDGEKV